MDIPIIRVVPENVSMWLVYAGVRRRHLDLFLRSRSVFLELPAFAATDDSFSDIDLLRRHLAMSDAFRVWLREQRGEPPSRHVRQYRAPAFASNTPEARSFNAEVGNIQRMFSDVKPGDLVLCPPIGHFKPFLIGEVTKPWVAADVLEVPFFDNEEIPVRKVRWLNTRLSRRDFPVFIAKHLIN
jgi:hypothetical protein